MNNKNQNGYVLVVVLLLLMTLVVVGLAALGTSSVENMLSGNMRLKARHDAEADAGRESSPPVVDEAVGDPVITRFPTIIADADLQNELTDSFPTDTVDISFVVDGDTVTVDLDRMYGMYCDASAIAFAEGGEGIGYGGPSGSCTYYRINSRAVGDNTSSSLGMVYKYKMRM